MFAFFYKLLWNIFKMHDVAKPFQMKLISSLENDKEKYFCVNKYKDFFFTDLQIGIVFQCQCGKKEVITWP